MIMRLKFEDILDNIDFISKAFVENANYSHITIEVGDKELQYGGSDLRTIAMLFTRICDVFGMYSPTWCSVYFVLRYTSDGEKYWDCNIIKYEAKERKHNG